jgi:hypothetical protein
LLNITLYFGTKLFSGRAFFQMFSSIREKSWSVLLVRGHISNDQVRGKRCENCKSTTEVLVANHSNPNLLLYGCKDNKCKHRLLRLDLDAEAPITQEFSQSTTVSAVCSQALVQ